MSRAGLASRCRCAASALVLMLLLALLAFNSASHVHADLQVNVRKDVVELVDGTKLECNVLMEGRKGVLVAVRDPAQESAVRQELIPLDKIKRILRGKDEGAFEGYQTEGEMARKVIQGSGYREKEKKEKPTEPIVPTGTINPAQPLAPVPHVAPTPALQPVPNKKLAPKEVTEAYLTRYPALKEAAELFLGGSANAQALLQKAQEGDPLISGQVRNFLTLFLQGGAAAPAPAAPKTPAAPKLPPERK